MSMIKGITVKLKTLKLTGRDKYNRPVYETDYDDIQNVLVAPTSSEDIANLSDLTGTKTLYTLAVPKKDNHDWHNCEVKFWGYTWRAVGEPIRGIDENIPLLWNTKVVVEMIDNVK